MVNNHLYQLLYDFVVFTQQASRKWWEVMSFIEGNRWCDRFKCVCVSVCVCTHVSDFSKYLHGKNPFVGLFFIIIQAFIVCCILITLFLFWFDYLLWLV